MISLIMWITLDCANTQRLHRMHCSLMCKYKLCLCMVSLIMWIPQSCTNTQYRNNIQCSVHMFICLYACRHVCIFDMQMEYLDFIM